MNALSPNPTLQIFSPPDFPLSWEQPDDPQFHWTRDREHNPQPITPMFASVAALTAGPGYQRVVPVYEEAVIGRHDRTINTYNYTRLEVFTGPPVELESRIRRHYAKTSAAAQRLSKTWECEWRPELEQHWAFWRDFDLIHASLPELTTHLIESLEHLTRMYEIHYLMGAPMWFAIDEFENFYSDLFPGSTPLEAHTLLQGFDNQTLKIGRHLWALGRQAKACLPVRRALQELPTAQVLPVLKSEPAAQLFLAAFNTFLTTYGRRSSLWDWGYPSWEDDPAPLLNNLRNYLDLPDRNLQAELQQAAMQRQAAIAQTTTALQGYPQPVLERFETVLCAAQTALILTEDHTYYLDFNGFGWMHRLVRHCGERLNSQGRLCQPDDAFYLEIGELQAILLDPLLNLQSQAVGRRTEAEYWRSYPEPLELGTRPAQPIHVYSPESRRMLRYIGGYLAKDITISTFIEPGRLHGQPGSPGIVSGPARIILNLDQAHRLQPGDILVTTTTAPPWTPLFLTAAGLVTDAGGLLSHGAVVAREYRLPAVVGTTFATTSIKDGQNIQIDGNIGIVRLFEEDKSETLPI